jgi:hypothetical protein
MMTTRATGLGPAASSVKENGVETHVIFTKPGSLTKAL